MALEIIEIGSDGPLIAAGINQGDIIIKINDKPSTWNNLTQSLKLAFPGDIIDLEILNDGVPTLLSIKTEPIN